MPDQSIKEPFFYTPGAIINVISNAINVSETKRLVTMRGIYIQGKGQNYSGVYYDALKDETGEYQVTLIVPGLLRNQLQPEKVIECNGYITRKSNNRGQIEIQVNLTQLLSQTQNVFTAEEIKALEVQQQKSAAGYRDVESYLKAKIVRAETIKVVVIVGRTNIIHDDIKTQMKEAVGFYDLQFLPVNFASLTDLERALLQNNTDAIDILAVSRGGGDNLEIFNEPSLAALTLPLKPLFVTAIGHKQDITLLQKMADKAFITPTAFGQFLHDVYNNTKAELENSRAQLIADVTKQLQTNYDKQVANLNQELHAVKELHAKTVQSFETQKQQQVKNYEQRISDLDKQLTEIKALETQKQNDITAMTSQQLKALQLQLTQQEKFVAEANAIAANYKQQLDNAKAQAGIGAGTVLVMVIIAIIVGLIIGVLAGK